MIKSIVAATVLLASMTGCAQESYGNSYQVILDPTFSAEDTTAALDAIASWEAISNNLLHLTPVIGVGGECAGKPAAHTICVHTSDQATIQAMGGASGFVGFTKRESNDAASIYIPVSKDIGYSQVQMTTIFAHELGHAFGMAHISDIGKGVMFPGFGGATALPTCVDYAQLVSLRGGESFDNNPVCTGKDTSYTIDNTPGN